MRPVLKLDRIYSSVAGSIARTWTDQEARRCSDHLPLVSEIRVGSAVELASRI
jgi:endonuclease/exonuclease/phosphatase family metal-dependent hydrolase